MVQNKQLKDKEHDNTTKKIREILGYGWMDFTPKIKEIHYHPKVNSYSVCLEDNFFLTKEAIESIEDLGLKMSNVHRIANLTVIWFDEVKR